MTVKEQKKLIDRLIEQGQPEMLIDALSLCKILERDSMTTVSGTKAQKYKEIKMYDQGNFDAAHAAARRIRAKANQLAKAGYGQDMLDLYYACHLFDAPHFFDSFCIYIEKDREMKRQFYLPRRKQLLECANALQDFEEGKITLLGISEPPGVGKTTIAEFFLAWTVGRNPELACLIGSHSNPFLDGVYAEMLRILDLNGEYRWGDVFPGLRVISTNARTRMIDVGMTKKDCKRFASLEFGSIGSQLAGRVRAQNLLYCDDLVDGIETAMSKDRLDKLWQQYYTDLRQRKIGDRCKELHIATRWSLHDVIGRLEAEYGDDPLARFIRFSALDENDESNFDYPYGLGYTTEDLHKQRDIMDDASWRALYCNEPIEREGQLYDPSELRRFFELPEQEPDAVFAICDTKEQGGDYAVMPVLYQYGEDFYVDFILCDNGKVEVIEERVARILVDRKVKMCRIESNRGGTLFAQNVQKRIKELGGITNITTKWTQTNKETRIEINSGWVKAHCIFKDESEYKEDKEYRTAMNFLCSYSIAGKNKHDDVPDVFSMVVDYVTTFGGNRAEVIKRMF